jgi:hypothetical protein
VCIHKRLRDGLCRLECFFKTPLRFNGRQDVQTLAARCFDERMLAEAFEMLLESPSEFRDLHKRTALRRIEIVNDIVWLIEMWRA